MTKNSASTSNSPSRTSSNPWARKSTEVSPGTLLFAKASVVTAVLLILSQNVLQAVREYSAGAALICSINGNKTCVDRAQLVAKYV